MEIVSKTTPRAVQISMPIPMGRGLVVARGRGQGGAGDFLNLDVDLGAVSAGLVPLALMSRYRPGHCGVGRRRLGAVDAEIA